MRKHIPSPCSSRSDRRGQARHQAAGVCLRYRSGCDRPRREGLYPGKDRGRVSPARGLRASSRKRTGYRVIAGTAGLGRFHGAGRAGRSALLPPRFGIVPKSADLPASGSAGEGSVAVSFRPARRRHPAARHLGNRRRRPVRSHFEIRSHLPAYRPRPPGRARFFGADGDGVRTPAGLGQPRRRRARRFWRSCAGAW